METNPYLRKLGIEPEITMKDGTVMTLRNPALMTREISELVARENGVGFRLTSFNPVNPVNTPDRFEADALASFARGSKEEWAIDDTGGEPVYRLIRPLFIEEPCMRCHKSKGYKTGDLRGALSVSIPIGSLSREFRNNSLIILTLGTLTLALLLGTLYMMSIQLSRRLHEAQEIIKEFSITDGLTGLRNRRFIMEKLSEEFERSRRSGKPLGVMMLDLDHFKRVNDTYGHPFGDAVLKAAASRIMAHLRPYDMAGRFGGEEFLVVCPDVTPGDMVGIAERTRLGIQSERIGDGDTSITVTASIGITASTGADSDIETLLKRADDALYKASTTDGTGWRSCREYTREEKGPTHRSAPTNGDTPFFQTTWAR
ncbi:MAG: diguanylate cyclase [Nitrospirae bacterium]|nr:diguanylate cyclase [Nitrospirota bacterium]